MLLVLLKTIRSHDASVTICMPHGSGLINIFSAVTINHKDLYIKISFSKMKPFLEVKLNKNRFKNFIELLTQFFPLQ